MNKEQIILTGSLAAPLCKGCRARIRYAGGLISTSPVINIRSLSPQKAVFETVHSVYHIALDTIPFAMALMDTEPMCA